MGVGIVCFVVKTFPISSIVECGDMQYTYYKLHLEMRLTFKGKWRMVTKAGVEAQLEAVKNLSHLIRNF